MSLLIFSTKYFLYKRTINNYGRVHSKNVQLHFNTDVKSLNYYLNSDKLL